MLTAYTGPRSAGSRQDLLTREKLLAVWDEEFRVPVFRVGDEPQYLYLRVLREEGRDDSELIGEAKVLLDGSWTEFDGQSPVDIPSFSS